MPIRCLEEHVVRVAVLHEHFVRVGAAREHLVRSHAFYERVGPEPLGACTGGSRIRLASTSEWLVGSCPDKRN